MGRCFSRTDKLIEVELDPFLLTQKQLGLGLIHIQEFTSRLKAEEEDQKIELNRLTQIFKDIEFGQRLADPNLEEVNNLLEHPLFLKDGMVSYQALICLGAIYTQGTIKEKAQILWNTFDKNKDGSLFINSVKVIFRNIFTIVGIIIPTIDTDIPNTINPITEETVLSLTDDKLMVFFKNEFKISKSRFMGKVQSDFKALSNSIDIRKCLREVKLESEHSELA